MSATPHAEVHEAIARFEAQAEAAETEAILAAHGLAHGARNRITAEAMIRRPGTVDTRFRDVRLGCFAVPTAETERLVLDALRALAERRGATLVVRAPGPGCANHVAEWLASRGPSPKARFTLAWRLRFYDRDGHVHDEAGTDTVEAFGGAGAAQQASLRRHVPSGAFLAGSSISVRELDRNGPPLWAGEHDVLRSTLDRATLRALSEAGVAPTEMLAREKPESPLDAMMALAVAWDAPMAEVAPIAAWARGEHGAAEVDAALVEVRRRAEPRWRLAHLLGAALTRDRIDPALAELARRAGAIQVIVALREATGLGLAEAKLIVGTLGALDDAALSAEGVLSRAIAEARALFRR